MSSFSHWPKRLLIGLWTAITWTRSLLGNLLFLGVVVIVVLAIRSAMPKPLPDQTALFIAPSGTLVDQLSFQPPLASLTGQHKAPETHLHSLIKLIREAKQDPRITGIILKLDDLDGGGISKIDELGQALQDFKSAGKPVLAYGQLLSQQQYLLGSYATQLFLHDMGAVGLTGFALYRTYLKGLLDKLGIQMHIFKAGTYKEFVEPFERDSMSDTAKAHNRVWLDSLWQQYREGVETRRQLPAGSLDRLLAELPERLKTQAGDSAQLAIRENLVDLIGDDQQRREWLIAQFGADAEHPDQPRAITSAVYWQAMTQFTPPPPGNIALIEATGTIGDGEAEAGSIGDETLLPLIHQVRNEPRFKALVIRIDSGGGSAFASERIRQALLLTKNQGKPVVVSMGSMAASGGYWIASAGTEIWASPATLTGSIGVFSLMPGLAKTFEKMGLTSDGIATAETADLLHLNRPLSERNAALVQASVDAIYARFLSITAQARKLPLESLPAMAEGRVWLGAQAKELGLVDQLGGLDDALAAAAKLAAVDNPVTEIIAPALTPLEQLMQNLNGHASVHGLNPARWGIDTQPLAAMQQVLARDPWWHLVQQQRRKPSHPFMVSFCSDCFIE